MYNETAFRLGSNSSIIRDLSEYGLARAAVVGKENVSHLTEHVKSNKKDFNTSRSLKMLVGKRRRMLDFLKEKDIERYRSIVKKLGLRK